MRLALSRNISDVEYHAQFDGRYPWVVDEVIVNCSDAYNVLTIKL